jgi:hypothetical protein
MEIKPQVTGIDKWMDYNWDDPDQQETMQSIL